MIEKLVIIIADGVNPYENLGLEEYLVMTAMPNELILYLWQNERTVVIGKNQDCYAECLIEKLEAENGFLARRLSGGGAVYHDLGNLNFTFITSNQNHDISKQTDVILYAINAMDLEQKAFRAGRNDLLISDKKFSGNAYYNGVKNAYHHGTIMVNADIDNLTKYLNVPKDKLKTKGVSSVRSRVTNISDYAKDGDIVTIGLIKEKLISSAKQIYNISEDNVIFRDIKTTPQLDMLIKKYASNDWKYNISGKKISDIDIKDRFSWGGINIKIWLTKDSDIISDCKIYSDAMDVEFISLLADCLIGKNLNGLTLADCQDNNDVYGLIQKHCLENI